MRRSLISVAMASASSRRGARSTSRSVSSTENFLAAKLAAATASSKVIARAPQMQREGAGIPSPPLGTRRSAGSTGCRPDLDVIRRLFGCSLRHRLYRYENAAFGFGTELDATGGERE